MADLVWTALICLAIGSIFFWLAYKAQRRCKAIESWPSVEGRILKSAFGATHPRLKNSILRHLSSFYPSYEISYAYVVDGVDYTFDVVIKYRASLILGLGLTLERYMERYARFYGKRFPLGDTVRLSYNPERPDKAIYYRAFSNRGGPFVTYTLYAGLLATAGLIFVGTAIWISVVG